jgi:hypothetical protein
VLDYVAAATLDDDLPLLEIVGARVRCRTADTWCGALAHAYATDCAFCARIGREHLPAEPKRITRILPDHPDHRGLAARGDRLA